MGLGLWLLLPDWEFYKMEFTLINTVFHCFPFLDLAKVKILNCKVLESCIVLRVKMILLYSAHWSQKFYVLLNRNVIFISNHEILSRKFKGDTDPIKNTECAIFLKQIRLGIFVSIVLSNFLAISEAKN